LFSLVEEAGHGTKALRTDVLLDTPFLVPPLEDQYLIMEFLDGDKKQTDQAIEKITASIEQLTEYRAALVTAAVTGQIEGLQ
jgi:type I restriction enzyme S subunit